MIDLSGYKLTFDEEFNSRSISKTGAGTTWADIRAEWKFDAHSDIGFGKSSFVDATSGYDPFKVANGALTITAVPDTTKYGYAGSWESGLIHTKGSFSQTYGYFEMRADLSDSVGSWDAFWMLPVDSSKATSSGWQELDIVEHYGVNNNGVYSHIHTTDKSISSGNRQLYSDNTPISSGYHTFGLEWNEKTLKFYVDGILKGTRATPNDMHSDMYLLANLATESGAKSPMSMSIDYIRAYSEAPGAVAVKQDTVSAPDGKDPGLYGATSKSVAAEIPVLPAPPAVPTPVPVVLPPVMVPPVATLPPVESQMPTKPTGLILNGTSGNDRLSGGAFDDTISGGAGRDEINGGAGSDKLYGGDGDDVIRADANDAVIDGGEGRDILYVQGGKGMVLDLAKASIEEAIGGVSDDRFDGSAVVTNMKLSGGDGDDTLIGGVGRDEITGGAGSDKLYGGDGDDIIRADADDAAIHGGAGRDIVYVQGTAGMKLDLAKASIEEAVGGVGNDEFNGFGSTVKLKLSGGDGDDRLIGGTGRDELSGGNGADDLYGGLGGDILTGGKGNDLFIFNVMKVGNVTNVKDFEKGQDKMVIDADAFGWAQGAGDLPNEFFFASDTGRAQDADDRVLYNTKTGDISFDADGSGAGKAIVFAHVDPKLVLTLSDFHIWA